MYGQTPNSKFYPQVFYTFIVTPESFILSSFREDEMMQADQPVVEEEAVENEDEEDEAEAETEAEAVAEVEYETEDDNEDDNDDESDIKLAFIATRSGLMRFKEEFDDDNDEQA